MTLEKLQYNEAATVCTKHFPPCSIFFPIIAADHVIMCTNFYALQYIAIASSIHTYVN